MDGAQLSDSELPPGLPSDVEQEPLNENLELGLTVPTFINKLREEVRPLLSLSKGVPSPTKQLKENGVDKPKDSRAKKRLFRGRQEPPNGVIERRYGYIPNPRWGKPVTQAYGRQFVPQGVGDGDRSGVPGVVFRDGQADTALSNDLLRDQDFPCLGASASESRLSFPEQNHRSNQPKRGKLLQSRVSQSADESNLLSETGPSLMLGRRSASPMTSTPVRQSNRVLQCSSPGLGHSSLESTYFSAVESVEDSPRSQGTSVRSVESTSAYERSAGENIYPNRSSNSNRRHAKKLVPSPLAASPVTSCNKSFDRSCLMAPHPNHSALKSSASWSDIARSSPTLPTTLPDMHLLEPSKIESPPEQSELNDNFSGTKWSQVLKNQSPALPVPSKANGSRNGEVFTPSSNLEAWPVASSPRNRSVKLAWGNGSKEDVNLTSFQQPDIVLSNMVNSLPSPIDQSENTYPCSKDGSLHLAKTTMLNSLGSTAASPGHLGEKSEKVPKKPRHRKAKHSGSNASGTITASDNRSSSSPRSSPVPWAQKERKQNSKPRGSGKGPTTSPLTLENFITSNNKGGTKKNGLRNDKKDISMLENRFVEHIAANPTSPPKKVRPSPIKKLSFQQREESAGPGPEQIAADGDAASAIIKDSQKLETLREYVKTQSKQVNDGGDKKVKCNVVKDSSTETATMSLPSQNKPVFSMNKYFRDQTAEMGDVFEEENEDEDEYPDLSVKRDVDRFWAKNAALPPELVLSRSGLLADNGEEEYAEGTGVGGQFLSPLKAGRHSDCGTHTEEEESLTVGGVVQADPTKVHHKRRLTKMAQRYCHYCENHQVPNMAVEVYFVVQLLTCTEVDKDILDFVDLHCGGTLFRSVHNGVYFAVKVIRRLRRLFSSLGKMYVELLAESDRIKLFSPYLHKFFKQALLNRAEDSDKPVLVEHFPYSAEENGTNSFPDANHAHVFKCQRDNFYAFYRHYHDTNSVYEFRIENQIQYVYDGCTPEQNSMVNLMHLAKLYVDHLILCCVTQRQEAVDVIKMIQAKGADEKQFTALYEAFFAATSTNSGTAAPPPGFSDHEMFFRDFIETLSSPAFNEHLKNLLVVKILELNAQTFSNVRNLHSACALGENETPLRTKAFTDTVLTLCVLAKVLGYLTFAPYTSGFQSLSQEQASSLLSMREMTPLPLPLPLLLKQAFDGSSLSLTVPWIVEFLSLMDCMAPQLSVYSGLLRKLCYIQKFAWDRLYSAGFINSGLLVASCISWLFESPPVPVGFFYLCKSSVEEQDDFEKPDAFSIDHQNLVSRCLLTRCCPYLEQGQVLMTLFALKQKIPVCDMAVIPLSPCSTEDDENVENEAKRLQRDMDDIERWLGSSLLEEKTPLSSPGKRQRNVIDDEVVPAYVLTRLLTTKDKDELEDLEHNLLLSDPYMKSVIENTVDLLCAKVADFTHKTILRLLVFTCKAEVRQHFVDSPDAPQAELIKNRIMAGVNMAAARLTATAKKSFYEVAERVCHRELPGLLKFLSNVQDSAQMEGYNHLAGKMCLLRLQEWACVQLGPEIFRRTITREAKRCARVTGKPVALYPNDYAKKIEEYRSPEITPGFVELEQLSELIDTALSYGVWYINSLTPGQRPNADHMIKLITNFTSCVEKRMITMDFAFYVMSNFLMHLVIQYMVDAPSNWTTEAEQAFVQLCVLCKDRKLENDRSAVHLPAGSNGRKPKPGVRMKVKVLNLLSVHTLSWLAKTQVQDETMMVYCRLLSHLVAASLLHIETVCSRLTHSRDNKNLSLLAKTLANKAMVKVLALLYWTPAREKGTHREEGQPETEVKHVKSASGSEEPHTFEFHQAQPQPCLQQSDDQARLLEESASYSKERVLALVMDLRLQTPAPDYSSTSPSDIVKADLTERLEVSFGNVLADAKNTI